MFRSPPVDLIVVLIIVLLILGPKRLPGIGKGLGQGMREFKDGITGESKPDEAETPSINQATATPGTGAQAGAAAAASQQPAPVSQPAAGSAPADSQHHS